MEGQTWLVSLDFTNDIALLTETKDKLQEITTNPEEATEK